jgi:hypothetical protein
MTRSLLRRGVLAGAAAAAAVALGAGPAMAHHCFIPMYSLNGPSSPNWFVITAEMGAAEFGGFEAECEAARQGGYDALKDAGLPVGIKIFEKMTIGDPKGQGRMNPNGADGKGLEYFDAGSQLPFQMIETYVEGASAVSCS